MTPTTFDRKALDARAADYGFTGKLPPIVRIRVDGDCMEPFYQSGDQLFVLTTGQAAPGDAVIAVRPNGTLLCKFYRQGEAGDYLEPAHGRFRVTGGFRLVGIVRSFLRDQ